MISAVSIKTGQRHLQSLSLTGTTRRVLFYRASKAHMLRASREIISDGCAMTRQPKLNRRNIREPQN